MNKNVVWGILFGFSGFGLIANALFMLLAPATWYRELPAAVPDFGPYNEHFVRDIGCAMFVFGCVSLAAVRWTGFRLQASLLLAAFYGTHSLLHVFDTARGFVSAEHWLIDLPSVHVPAMIFIVMAVVAIGSERAA
ncbi:MAG: hypothetical protein JNM27_14670 [Leptospirales bacterium]|nr:hypothetical protein [Leptospirales bacterium]